MPENNEHERMVEEQKQMKEKLLSMYKPSGFNELSSDVYHRIGYNLAIDEVLAMPMFNRLPPADERGRCPDCNGKVHAQFGTCKCTNQTK